jgi:O-antigen/teichoic acid export membrane protein
MWKRLRTGLPTLVDQALVSGGNFLTVALCAHLLPLEEQGQLGYVLAAYMATVVLNVPLIFQWAAVQAPRLQDQRSYEISLARLQGGVAVIFAGIGVAMLHLAQAGEAWSPTPEEAAWIAAFLCLQQVCDFMRRSAYIFRGEVAAAISSTLVYPLRVVLLLAFRPGSLQEVMQWVILSTAAPVVHYVVRAFLRGRGRMSDGVAAGELGAHVKNSATLVAAGAASWLWNYVPIFLLGGVAGMAAVAVLVSMRSISNVANLALEMLETSTSAKAGLLAANGGHAQAEQHVRTVRRRGLLAWVTGLVVFAVGGEPIVGLVLGASYADHWALLLVLWLLLGVVFWFRVGGIMLRTRGLQKVTLGSALAACVAVGILSPPMIAASSFYGAAWGLVAGATVNAVFQEVISRFIGRRTASP